nr:TRAP transporter small permease [Sulfitobacter algicola]
MSKLDQYFEEVICTICLAAVVISVLLRIVLREFFLLPVVWTEEIAVYGMIFAVYLGATMAVRDRAHIRITLLVKALPRPFQVASILLADFLWLAFVIFMIIQTLTYTQLLFNVTYQTPGLGIEQRWIQMFIPMAFILMLFRILQVYWRWYGDNWKGLPL